MGEGGVTSAYEEYDCNLTSNKTVTNATANNTDQGKQENRKFYAINSNNKVKSYINKNRDDDLKSLLRIYHLNIRGINGKIEEFMIHLAGETPDIICLMEHHLRDFENDVMCIPTYKLGAKFCRKNLKNGGVCIFIREDLKFTTINVHKYCKEEDFEIAVIQIICKGSKINIITLYRAPTGNFDYFINKLDFSIPSPSIMRNL